MGVFHQEDYIVYYINMDYSLIVKLELLKQS